MKYLMVFVVLLGLVSCNKDSEPKVNQNKVSKPAPYYTFNTWVYPSKLIDLGDNDISKTCYESRISISREKLHCKKLNQTESRICRYKKVKKGAVITRHNILQGNITTSINTTYKYNSKKKCLRALKRLRATFKI